MRKRRRVAIAIFLTANGVLLALLTAILTIKKIGNVISMMNGAKNEAIDSTFLLTPILGIVSAMLIMFGNNLIKMKN